MTRMDERAERVAVGVEALSLAGYQRAARALLVHPLITRRHPTPTTLALVRRWEPTLREDFATVFGYRLDVTPSCARLVKRQVWLDASRPLLTPSKRAFDRRRYAYLCLVLACLQGSGAQVLLTDLADRVRHRAETIDGLGFDTQVHTHRVALVDVLRWLERHGALTPCDGDAGGYVRDPEQDALYDVDAEVVHLLAPLTSATRTGSAALFPTGASEAPTGRDARRRQRRQSLCRLLVERPLVAFDDLDEGDRAYLVREARSMAADLERMTGATTERRAEGVALLDVDGSLSDRRFPSTGTVGQVALLLLEHCGTAGTRRVTPPTLVDADAALRDQLDGSCPRRDPATNGFDPGGAYGGLPSSVAREDREGEDLDSSNEPAREPTQSPFIPHAELLATVRGLCDRYGRAFKRDLRDDPERLCRLAVDELTGFDLARKVPGGVVLLAPAARYRPEVDLTLLDDAGPTPAEDAVLPLWGADSEPTAEEVGG
jgi:uncharacterized protein (TIGR02678 family)